MDRNDLDKHPPKLVPPNESKFLSSEDKAKVILAAFREENELVRSLVLRDIVAEDTLCRLGAADFKELCLERIASERGILYNKYSPPSPACAHCGCIPTTPVKDKDREYYCSSCKKTFSLTRNTIVSRTKVPLLTYAKLIHCLLNYELVERTCELCDIAITTYYNLRNRIFWAISVYLDQLKLAGRIQADELFLNISYKGKNLRKSEYDYGDDRFPDVFSPRDSRDRGGPYSGAEAARNKLCIFAAVDDRGYVRTCLAGIGNPSVSALRNNVPEGLFLKTVPDPVEHPYPLKPPLEDSSPPGTSSLLIFDGSKALKKYAAKVLEMPFYSRVYRRNGVQVTLPKKYRHLNIQRVNYIHHRLREHLFRSGYGSSHYIKGTLLLFDFKMNTGAPKNKDAISALLRILVQPGLHKSKAFLESYFCLPNFYIFWKNEDSALLRFPPAHLMAFSLYDRYKHPEQYPNSETPTFDYIEYTSGLSMPTVRHLYRDFIANGYRDRILRLFQGTAHNITIPNADNETKKHSRSRNNSIDAAALAIFDRYAEELQKPKRLRTPLNVICKEVNAEFGSKYSGSHFSRTYQKIIELGLREEPEKNNDIIGYVGTSKVTKLALDMLTKYQETEKEIIASTGKSPKSNVVYDTLESLFPGYSRKTIINYISSARSYCEQQGVPNDRKQQYRNPMVDLGYIYALYAQYRASHSRNNYQEKAFWDKLYSDFNIGISRPSLYNAIMRMSKTAANEGLKPLPDYLPAASRDGLSASVTAVAETCKEIMALRDKKGLPPLTKAEMIKELQKTFNLSPNSLSNYLSSAKISFPRPMQENKVSKREQNIKLATKAYEKLVSENTAKGLKPPSFAAASVVIKEKNAKLSHLAEHTICNYLSLGMADKNKRQ